jgi:hypothetical protein
MEMPEYLIDIYDLFENVIGEKSDPEIAKARRKNGSS